MAGVSNPDHSPMLCGGWTIAFCFWPDRLAAMVAGDFAGTDRNVGVDTRRTVGIRGHEMVEAGGRARRQPLAH